MADSTTKIAEAAADNSKAWRAETRATLKLAWPLAAAQIGQIAINTTDVIMIGWLGTEALAASALGTWLFLTLYLFGLGMLTPVAGLTAQALGAGDSRGVRRTVRQGLWVAVTLAVPFTVMMAQAEYIFALFRQPPGAAALAVPYVAILKWTLLPSLAYVALRFFVTALGHPRIVMATMMAGVALNALLDYALIFGEFGAPALGLEGAALATVGVNCAMFAALAIVAMKARPFRGYEVFARIWRSDWRRYLQILRIGSPSGTGILMEIGLFAAAVYLMGLIGPAEVAAHQIAIQVVAVTFMVPLGISQAATVRSGLALGRNDREGIGRAAWVALALGVGFMAMTAILIWALPRQIVGLFIDVADPANSRVVDLAVQFLWFAAAFQVFDGAQAVGSGFLRGLNDTKVPMLLAGLCFWVIGFPVAVWLGFVLDWQGTGIWIGLSVSLFLYAGTLVLRIRRRGTAVAACRELAARVQA